MVRYKKKVKTFSPLVECENAKGRMPVSESHSEYKGEARVNGRLELEAFLREDKGEGLTNIWKQTLLNLI